MTNNSKTALINLSQLRHNIMLLGWLSYIKEKTMHVSLNYLQDITANKAISSCTGYGNDGSTIFLKS